MKYKSILFISAACIIITAGCSENKTNEADKTKMAEVDTMPFEVDAERFGDLQVLRYQVKGFEELSLQQKQLAYYLYEAAMCGRDIVYDQKYKYNLTIRKTIDAIYSSYTGDKSAEDWKKFEVYAKRIWFSNGIHHHYSNMKMMPEFSKEYFYSLIKSCDPKLLPLEGNDIESLATKLTPILFDEKVDAKIVDQSAGIDNIKASANNFYEGLSQKEVEAYYAKMADKGNKTPIMYGLNSKLVKENGKIVEKTWKVGGMYTAAIEKIVFWLEKASGVAENAEQKLSLDNLIKFYKSGDLKDFDEYSIAWVKDVNSRLDVVNGFIEVYGDAIGKRGSFESVVSMKDMEATKTIAAIAKEAQWFEDNSPIAAEHKKKEVKGITAKVITVIAEAGDAAPSTPIGINLPNSNWIREQHGSKSVSLGNIVESYNVVGAKSPQLKEFAYDDAVVERAKKHGALAGNLHTDMHEVIGHASGKINEGISTPDVTLKNYANCLEEARADLVALYFIYDKKLINIGVMPSLEVGKAEYDNYILNGLIMQLTRIKLGDHLEEAHMRNRQLVASWAFEKGKKDNVIEMVKKDGKTYVKVNDYEKLRTIFGELLKEIQRIKSEGDYKSATALVEGYGVKVDKTLHQEILERFEKLNVAPYKGFIQPKLVPVMEGDKITDVKIEYPKDFSEQMLEYGKKYNFLPVIN
jgi:dipeptidyl-peptidase III